MASSGTSESGGYRIRQSVFINQEIGREFIAEMSPEKLFVYHLPPEQLDEFRMRRQAETDLIKYRGQLERYGTELVSSPMELIFKAEKRS